jgi:glycosyltransferase involved in cell wall biosynthesis
MKILLLSPFFFPEQISTGKYNTYLAEALAAMGHEVTVLASHPIYPNWRAEISHATLPKIEIKRGGSWITYPRSATLRRAFLELWFAWYVLTGYFKLESRPDVVVPIFPPSLFFMVLHALLPRSVCRVGIVHDLQGVYAAKTGGFLSQLVNGAIHFIEKRCFRVCDGLIFLSSSMARRAIAEYKLIEQRCSVCYPFVAIADGSENSTALAEVLLPDRFNVVYSGALGKKHNAASLFEFMNAVAHSQSNVVCHIFSAGPLFEDLRLVNQGLASCKVQFHDLVPADHLAELYARSDLQIIPQAADTGDGSLPSKLPNLLAAGVPVFAICEVGSELGDLVIEADAGIVANSWDIASLTGLFESYKNTLGTESKADQRARLQTFVSAKFSIDTVVGRVLDTAKTKMENK